MPAYNVIYTTGAEMDIAETVDYYDTQQEGLSQRFIIALRSDEERLRLNPFHYSAYGNTRFRALPMKTFSFLLIYEVQDEEILVVSVRHTSRASITD